MADAPTDPRTDATTTIAWKRLKDVDMATPAEQVLMHNQGEIMKELQRMTLRVENLGKMMDKQANVMRGRKFSNAGTSAVGSQLDNVDEGDIGELAQGTAACNAILHRYDEQIAVVFKAFIAEGYKLYKSRTSGATAPAVKFVDTLIKELNVNNQNILEGCDEAAATELSSLLNELKETNKVDLYVKLGKKHQDMASKGKGREPTKRKHRQSLESLAEEDEDDGGGQPAAKRPRESRRSSIATSTTTSTTTSSRDEEADEDDDVYEEGENGEEVEED